MGSTSLAALRRFVPARGTEERCDGCGASLPVEHQHQFDPRTRRIRCACAPCAQLGMGVYRDIPARVTALKDFEMTDAQWDDLLIPISLAFFTYSSVASRVIAMYPGPAGASESLLRLDAWAEIAEANSQLRTLTPDVEALLVNRVGSARQYFIVPIDECYKLVGIIRTGWSGLSGGAAVWGKIAAFFERLQRRAISCPA